MIIFLRKAFTLVEIMIVVAIVAIILAIALPNYLTSSETSKKTACINNLKTIDAAVDQWAIDYNIATGTSPSAQQEEDIYNYVKGGKPKCPSGGTYTIYQVGVKPQVRCSLENEDHKLPE
ncbi:MAG: prepilin-type N-terminal cleavage/methylation domain-containing protein [Candidatus Omnitrophica bacterium]|nr:prepilin-type N-terminal cleavage/methylation domain-containing protein [Candidatus Omnitrophota bacterium]